MAASFIGIMALVCRNITNNTSAIQPMPAIALGDQGLNHNPNENSKAVVEANRSSLTRSPVWSLNQPQPYGAASRVADCTAASKLMLKRLRPCS